MIRLRIHLTDSVTEAYVSDPLGTPDFDKTILTGYGMSKQKQAANDTNQVNRFHDQFLSFLS